MEDLEDQEEDSEDEEKGPEEGLDLEWTIRSVGDALVKAFAEDRDLTEVKAELRVAAKSGKYRPRDYSEHEIDLLAWVRQYLESCWLKQQQQGQHQSPDELAYTERYFR